MNSFGNSIQNCSIIYNMYKKGLISKDKLFKIIKSSPNKFNKNNFDFNFDHSSNSCNSNNSNKKVDLTVPPGKKKNRIIIDGIIIQWFLPEIS